MEALKLHILVGGDGFKNDAPTAQVMVSKTSPLRSQETCFTNKSNKMSLQKYVYILIYFSTIYID